MRSILLALTCIAPALFQCVLSMPVDPDGSRQVVKHVDVPVDPEDALHILGTGGNSQSDQDDEIKKFNELAGKGQLTETYVSGELARRLERGEISPEDFEYGMEALKRASATNYELSKKREADLFLTEVENGTESAATDLEKYYLP